VRHAAEKGGEVAGQKKEVETDGPLRHKKRDRQENEHDERKKRRPGGGKAPRVKKPVLDSDEVEGQVYHQRGEERKRKGEGRGGTGNRVRAHPMKTPGRGTMQGGRSWGQKAKKKGEGKKKKRAEKRKGRVTFEGKKGR